MHVNPVVCPFVSFVNVCLVVLESLETIRDASRGSRRRHTSSSPRSTTGLRCHYVESLGHLMNKLQMSRYHDAKFLKITYSLKRIVTEHIEPISSFESQLTLRSYVTFEFVLEIKISSKNSAA